MYVIDSPTNSSNSSNIVCQGFEQTLLMQISKTCMYALIIILSVIGNSLVILTIYKNQHMRSVTNLFISNLAVSDLLVTFLAMPNMITQLYLSDKWLFGEFMCKLVVFLQSASVASSVLTLLAITKDRFVAIVFPFKSRMRFRTASVLLVVIWLAAFAVMSPFLYAMRISNAKGYEVCVEDWAPAFDPSTAPRNYTVILFVCLYLTPLLTMAILYSIIGWKLWRRKSLGEQVSSSVDPAQTAKKKVIKMLISVVGLFAACWLPLYIYQFIVFFALHKIPCFDSSYIFYFISLFLSHANSAINPFLYALFNRNYRDGFLAACSCFKTKNNAGRASKSFRTQTSITRNSSDELGQDDIDNAKGVNAHSVRRLLTMNNVRAAYFPNNQAGVEGKDNRAMSPVTVLSITAKVDCDNNISIQAAQFYSMHGDSMRS